MAYIKAYKKLDNLCKDLLSSEKGVSSYIDEMISIGDNKYVTNWDADLKKLKKYRYIRNQIVHDNNADESSMCTADDVQWVKQFYNRIMNKSDPLALYRKAKENAAKLKAQKKKNNNQGHSDFQNSAKNKKNSTASNKKVNKATSKNKMNKSKQKKKDKTVSLIVAMIIFLVAIFGVAVYLLTI